MGRGENSPASNVGDCEHDEEREEGAALNGDVDVVMTRQSHLAQNTVAHRPETEEDERVGQDLGWPTSGRTPAGATSH